MFQNCHRLRTRLDVVKCRLCSIVMERRMGISSETWAEQSTFQEVIAVLIQDFVPAILLGKILRSPDL